MVVGLFLFLGDFRIGIFFNFLFFWILCVGTCNAKQQCTCEKNWDGKTCNEPTMENVVSELKKENEEEQEDKEEIGAVELMKEMNEESKDDAKKATLLEMKETKETKLVGEDEHVAPCNNNNVQKSYMCDPQQCRTVGGTCYAGVGCVCSAPSISDFCVQDLRTAATTVPTSTVERLSASATRPLQQPQQSSTSWNAVSIIMMSITGCLAIVGLLAMVMLVVYQKSIRTRYLSGSNVKLDANQTSLLIEQRVLEQERMNFNFETVAEDSVATGFVSRR